MSKYSSESAFTLGSVFIRSNMSEQNIIPTAMSTAHSTAVAISEEYTAVLSSL